jgi:phosphosulfolactate synthase (CoM biosynthesis protein A)
MFTILKNKLLILLYKKKKQIMAYLRDGGIITEKEYLGKTLEEATQYAKDGGFEVRIVEIDGQSKMLTMEVKSNRINFIVRGGYITSAYGG